MPFSIAAQKLKASRWGSYSIINLNNFWQTLPDLICLDDVNETGFFSNGLPLLDRTAIMRGNAGFRCPKHQES